MEALAVVLVAVLVYGFGVPCPTIPKVTEVTENETPSYEQPEFSEVSQAREASQ